MFDALVRFLIGVCFLALAVYLVIWVFAVIGIALPAQVVSIIWVIVALVGILMLSRLLWPHVGGYLWPPAPK